MTVLEVACQQPQHSEVAHARATVACELPAAEQVVSTVRRKRLVHVVQRRERSFEQCFQSPDDKWNN